MHNIRPVYICRVLSAKFISSPLIAVLSHWNNSLLTQIHSVQVVRIKVQSEIVKSCSLRSSAC